MASNFPTPIDITHDKDRTILIELSQIALAQFNADQVWKLLNHLYFIWSV
jgi:hypothetical protein